jgi:hypothetical protein
VVFVFVFVAVVFLFVFLIPYPPPLSSSRKLGGGSLQCKRCFNLVKRKVGPLFMHRLNGQVTDVEQVSSWSLVLLVRLMVRNIRRFVVGCFRAGRF